MIPKTFPAVAAAVGAYNDIKTKTIAAYPHVFSDTLANKQMFADSMKIFLKENAVPYRVSAPRPIPLRFQEPANSEIENYVKSGIIIPCDETTDWCSPAFFVLKGDGKRVRLVTDYTRLNKFVVRLVHPFPSVSDIVQSIPASSTCFAKLDATHGYFQIPRSDEASKLTTFLLPSGCYRYLRVPMGLSSSSDEWCRHSDRVVEGFPWCKNIVDDIVIWASNPQDLRLRAVVARCDHLHVTLSHGKFQISSSLSFAGCIVS